MEKVFQYSFMETPLRLNLLDLEAKMFTANIRISLCVTVNRSHLLLVSNNLLAAIEQLPMTGEFELCSEPINSNWGCDAFEFNITTSEFASLHSEKFCLRYYRGKIITEEENFEKINREIKTLLSLVSYKRTINIYTFE